MQKKYLTSRLVLRPVNLHDAAFILELLNTKGWIQFIGDRKVNTTEDSRNYIQKIMANPHTLYWVARLEREHTSVGIISFIKRSYLEHWDIGFAFLPAFFGKGYARESAEKILQEMLKNPQHATILATTKVDNQSSIHLIEKIGFHFKKEMENETERLLLYSITAN
jgi:ribosomal-protein-alanine N-acetyltransferase